MKITIDKSRFCLLLGKYCYHECPHHYYRDTNGCCKPEEDKMKETKLEKLLRLIEELDKLKTVHCTRCKGSGYEKLPDWRGHYGVTCKAFDIDCNYGSIIVDNDFRWEHLKKIIKEIKEESK